MSGCKEFKNFKLIVVENYNLCATASNFIPNRGPLCQRCHFSHGPIKYIKLIIRSTKHLFIYLLNKATGQLGEITP